MQFLGSQTTGAIPNAKGVTFVAHEIFTPLIKPRDTFLACWLWPRVPSKEEAAPGGWGGQD